ncbi:Asparaginyl-tRNA synthetase [Helicobacter felis]|uniref:Asparaginyl-tRNA synthetase n=1 Tax=Helicobacter felis (strain ATCC 49179 / CCUG 28539 / NCTC 12436 / CS1) TaxID=936155 RepID=E7A9L2_HELFC|nr:asparaginyl-tRNA synthetase [Helicobacter felis ATCC 49179]
MELEEIFISQIVLKADQAVYKSKRNIRYSSSMKFQGNLTFKYTKGDEGYEQQQQ